MRPWLNVITAALLTGFLWGVLHPLVEHKLQGKEPYGGLKGEILLDLAWGGILSILFFWMKEILPGEKGLLKGLSFGLGLWIIRYLLPELRSWIRKEVSPKELFFSLLLYLGETMLSGLILGTVLITRP